MHIICLRIWTIYLNRSYGTYKTLVMLFFSCFFFIIIIMRKLQSYFFQLIFELFVFVFVGQEILFDQIRTAQKGVKGKKIIE